jgi:hypothetical protein
MLEGDAVGDPVTVAKLQMTLGQTLASLGFPGKAAAVLEKCRPTKEAEGLLTNSAKILASGMGKFAPSERQRVLDAVQRVIDMYDSWDRADDAERWRKELTSLKAAK